MPYAACVSCSSAYLATYSLLVFAMRSCSPLSKTTMAEYMLPPFNTIIPELALIEVEPLLVECGAATPLCPVTVKIKLREVCLSSGCFALNVDNETIAINRRQRNGKTRICSGLLEESREVYNSDDNSGSNRPFLLQCRTNNCDDHGSIVPCRIRGFAIVSHTQAAPKLCVITDATFVRIVPSLKKNTIELPLCCTSTSCNGDEKETLWDSLILSCHDTSVVDSLALHMSIQLQKQCLVGTTSDAPHSRNLHNRRAQRCISFAKSFLAHKNVLTKGKNNDELSCSTCDPAFISNTTIATPSKPRISLLDEGVLCVFDETHGSGKTELVRAVARQQLHCHQVHIVTSGVLFAKYGALRADFGFQNLMHEIILGAAVRGEKVCIILDGLADFLPNQFSTASSPCLHAIAAYIASLQQTMIDGDIIPFPIHPFYSLGSNGFCLPVQLCIVGVLTLSTPSADLTTAKMHNNKHLRLTTTLMNNNLIGSSQFLLKPPSSHTRLVAFLNAFQFMGLVLDRNAEEELPKLAFSAVAARGASFLQSARKLRTLLQQTHRPLVTLSDLKEVLSPLMVEKKEGQLYFTGVFDGKVSYKENEKNRSHNNGTTDSSFLETVGGNNAAKIALEDALALNEASQMQLAKFGLSPVSAILFYGPPGTGKTLLARAAAEFIFSGHGGELGGSFLSLKASEVVRAEIGTSEKIIVNVFEMARSNSPSVIFIDEFEALFSDRGKGSGSSRLENTLMHCMDDVTKWRKADTAASFRKTDKTLSHIKTIPAIGVNKVHVLVLGATNMPWSIDRAFLRPGRFDRLIHVGLPSLEERQSIFQVHLRKMKLQYDSDCITDVKSFSEFLASRCDSFSGADIEALCRAAAVRCLCSGKRAVSVNDFTLARQHDVTGPSCDESMVARLLKWKPLL